MYMEKLEILSTFRVHNTIEIRDHFHLKEVTLGLSGKGTGVELPSLILPLLVNHSEDCWTTMGYTTWDTGTGRN